jgi:uncharacterized protein YjeT (DUF2065 family)
MSDFLTGLAFFLIIEGLVYALAPWFWWNWRGDCRMSLNISSDWPD